MSTAELSGSGSIPPEAAGYLAQAVALAVQNVGSAGGPFGALVVAPDGRVFEGTNRVTASNDPTAHAEVVAIRTACTGLESFDLTGCVLYSSCEPCPLCLSAALWARLDRIYFAADRHAAAAAGFDDAAFYEYIHSYSGAAAGSDLLPVEQVLVPESVEPFRSWAALDTRTDY
ncbi:nucleoside deaminase [Arthrobacter sp. I2-34]|uniref:Nucleoside deaminase n=1 Tax=Arthrobacter hankyongi TaxID=2904801 RepID=A0ABS9L162_9MICC|nr:nucleoside deaminase [Arthrobacter hankyongi]MCG2620376.1 nucleoside deaminase [Arthrobacter hankyongi]